MAQTTPTSIPYNGSGTINIHINNPTASLGGMPYMPMAVPYMVPMAYPAYSYPPNYYYNIYNNGYATPQNQYLTNQNAYSQAQSQALGQQGIQPQVPQGVPASIMPQTLQNNTSLGAQAASAVAASAVASASAGDKTKQRQIVVLTDNYIKNLENYLRNPNAELRKSAAKELLDRFKEDKSRINNPSLTALLNLALQDKNPIVRSLSMATLSAGYAKGDATTEQILKNMQNSKTDFSADALQAADTLLKMSQNKVMVPDNSHYTYQNATNNKKGK